MRYRAGRRKKMETEFNGQVDDEENAQDIVNRRKMAMCTKPDTLWTSVGVA